SMPAFYRTIRLELINFLFFIFCCAAVAGFLSSPVLHISKPYITIACGILALFIMLVIIIWFVPAHVGEPAVSDIDPSVANKRIRFRLPATKQQLSSRFLYSGLLFIAPIILVAHIH